MSLTDRDVEMDKAKWLTGIKKIAEITGAAVGGGAGILANGPLTAAAGGAIGVVIAQTITEVASRALSQREDIRIGLSARISIDRINELLEEGHKPRDDGFFDEERCIAEEVFEGCLMASKNSHEEKKALYLGYLFANLCFNNKISKDQTNRIVAIANRLTYSQLCILRAFIFEDIRSILPLINHDFTNNNATFEQIVVLQEIYELDVSGLAIIEDQHTFYFNQVTPSKVRTQGIGAALYELMELKKIPMEDWIGTIRPLLTDPFFPHKESTIMQQW